MVLDQYIGDYEEGRSPDWVRTISKPVVIFHPRNFMVSIMAFLAMLDINKDPSQCAMRWCKAASVSRCNIGISFKFTVLFTNTFLNRFGHQFSDTNMEARARGQVFSKSEIVCVT